MSAVLISCRALHSWVRARNARHTDWRWGCRRLFNILRERECGRSKRRQIAHPKVTRNGQKYPHPPARMPRDAARSPQRALGVRGCGAAGSSVLPRVPRGFFSLTLRTTGDSLRVFQRFMSQQKRETRLPRGVRLFYEWRSPIKKRRNGTRRDPRKGLRSEQPLPKATKKRPERLWRSGSAGGAGRGRAGPERGPGPVPTPPTPPTCARRPPTRAHPEA